MSTPNSQLGQIISTAPRLETYPTVSGTVTFLFDFQSDSNTSPIFSVNSAPVILALYNATDDEVIVEQVVFDRRGDMYTQPVVYNGLDVVLDAANTSAQLEYAGLYRLVASDGAIPNIVVAAIQNTVPSGIISLGK